MSGGADSQENAEDGAATGTLRERGDDNRSGLPEVGYLKKLCLPSMHARSIVWARERS